MTKYPAKEAFDIIEKELMPKLNLVRLYKENRTYAQLYAIGSENGKQFLLVHRGKKSDDGQLKMARQTKICFEKGFIPKKLSGVSQTKVDEGSFAKNEISKINPDHGQQVAYLIENEQALRSILWQYATDDYTNLYEKEKENNILDGIVKEYTQEVAHLKIDTTEAERLQKYRIGQNKFRNSLVEYWSGKCAVSQLDLTEILVASHIKPWAECTSDYERLDIYNGLLLSPIYDALFDKGLIGFTNNGEILISSNINIMQRRLLNLTGLEKIQGLETKHHKYLEWHRKYWFKN